MSSKGSNKSSERRMEAGNDVLVSLADWCYLAVGNLFASRVKRVRYWGRTDCSLLDLPGFLFFVLLVCLVRLSACFSCLFLFLLLRLWASTLFVRPLSSVIIFSFLSSLSSLSRIFCFVFVFIGCGASFCCFDDMRQLFIVDCRVVRCVYVVCTR